MSELTMTLLRLGYLLVLWVFVFAVVGVMRRDLYGTKITSRRNQPAAPEPVKASAPTTSSASPAHSRQRLVVVEGPLSGTIVPLTGVSVLIGRSPSSTLVVDDDYASSNHARIFLQNDAWFIEDLGSTNGTLINDVAITSPTELRPGVRARIGQSVLELQR